ncbi:MAG TPA: metallopeptidase TldD-related protein [Bryobacteraceae bacterium]
MNELEQIASRAVARALELGATDAECTLAEGEEFSAGVRMREVESLKQAGSRGAGIRVLVGRNTGSSRTSDLTEKGIEEMVRSALDLAQVTTEDPYAGLPDAADLGAIVTDLKLYDETIEGMDTDWKIAQARIAEETALSADPRISNSEGASFDSYLGARAFANSRGFTGSYRTTSCGLSVVPVAKSNGHMERDYWHTASRRASGIESAEEVGRRAAARTLRRLDARKATTQKAPVIFEPRTARSLLGDISDAVNGGAIYKHSSFLTGKLGEKVASEALTVIDDSTMPGLFGSTPFDDEGVTTRRTVVIEKGVLKSYLLNTYFARKLGLKTTGNASRGLSGNAGIGAGNFYIEAGVITEEAMIAQVRQGLYVTELIGATANNVTGDYSSGAAGVWIENGELTYAVSEITIAGNLKQMLMDLTQTASNLEFRGSVASPTIMIQEMTISGS